MFSLLTLDQSTLFYWTLSDVPPKKGLAINKWASAIPSRSRSMLQGPKSTSSCTRSIPSLTGSASHSSAPSILTDNIKVISHHSSDQVAKVESQANLPSFQVSDDGGLSDSNELNGKEREMAIKSPPKGKKRITSEVRSQLFQLITNILRMFLSRNSSLTNPQRRQHPKSLETRNYPSGLKLNGSVIPLSQLIWRLLVKSSTLGTFLSNSQSQ